MRRMLSVYDSKREDTNMSISPVARSSILHKGCAHDVWWCDALFLFNFIQEKMLLMNFMQFHT